MHQKGEARLGDRGKCGLQLLLVDHGKAVAARIDEEALEAENAGAGQRQNVMLIVRDRSAPRCPIDETFALCCGALLLQGDEVSVAAGCSCSRGRLKALPVGAPGFVDVNVCVHQSRQQGVVAAVVGDCIGGNLRRPADGEYLSVFHEQRTGLRAMQCNDAFRDEGMCHNLIIP
jgi:hypothetical protein